MVSDFVVLHCVYSFFFKQHDDVTIMTDSNDDKIQKQRDTSTTLRHDFFF